MAQLPLPNAMDDDMNILGMENLGAMDTAQLFAVQISIAGGGFRLPDLRAVFRLVLQSGIGHSGIGPPGRSVSVRRKQR